MTTSNAEWCDHGLSSHGQHGCEEPNCPCRMRGFSVRNPDAGHPESSVPGAVGEREGLRAALERIGELLLPTDSSAQGGRRWADVNEALGVAQAATSIRAIAALEVGNCPECDAPIGAGFGCQHWPAALPPNAPPEVDVRAAGAVGEREEEPRLTENEAHLLIGLVNERSKQAERDGADNGDLYVRLIDKLLVFRNEARLSVNEDGVAPACSGCGGTRWSEDENWSPDDPRTWRGGRSPGDGLIPCGFCNEGGWNVPVGVAPVARTEAEDR